MSALDHILRDIHIKRQELGDQLVAFTDLNILQMPGMLFTEVFFKEQDAIKKCCYLCHGDLNQHHLLMGKTYIAVTEFNKMHLGMQVEDLYDFMRKAMEKHEWNLDLGADILDAYERILPLQSAERSCLRYLFLYPEKYWKQINFYYNSNKAWIPGRNTEKVKSLEEQQEKRMGFIAQIL